MRLLLLAFILFLTNFVTARELESPHKGAKFQKIKDELTFFDAYDPVERMNRRIYKFNIQADTYVVKPLTDAYQFITPDIVEKGIHNFFSNLMQLPVLVNSALQFKGEKAVKTTGRLVVNLTVGVLGLWDPATKWCGMIKYNEDFGQTLGFYGVPTGPYLVLPIIGPSNCRDALGYAVDSFGLSLLYPNDTPFGVKTGVAALQLVDTRANATIMYGQFDTLFEYEKMRGLYLHARELLVNDGRIIENSKKKQQEKSK